MKFRIPKLEEVIFHQFRNKTFDDFECPEENQKSFQMVQTYCADIRGSFDEGLGLLFTGPPGVGKTMLANLVIKKAYEEKFFTDAVTMSNFVGLFHRKFDLMKLLELGDEDKFDQWDALDNRLQYLRLKAQFVLFDDVGKEYNSGSGWANDQLDRFLRHRYNEGLPSIITTNTPIEEWALRYSKSMESFLHESTIVIDLVQADYRSKWHVSGTR